MILQLRHPAKKAILVLWKDATKIPIYKKRKYKKYPSSFSLLSCLLKRIINTRLMTHLEANNAPFANTEWVQETEDQLALLAQEIENAFQEKKKTVAVLYDMYMAFDKV